MNKTKKKLGLYIRVSSEKQLKEGFSFEDQEEKLVEEAKREKREYILYKDGGITGTNTDKREGLKQLMIDVELGLISAVYVTKISRLARNSRDLQNIIYEFDQHDVSFKAISDGIDTSTPIGSLMVKLMGIFAEMERDTIMEQTLAGLNRRAKEGKMYGSGPILGYERVPDETMDNKTKKIIINEEEKPIIQTIFSMYIGGYGYKAITNRLNKDGLRTKRNKLFSINTVKNTLDNPLYAGYIRYGKFKNWTKKRRRGLSNDYILVKGNHEAIITKEEWDIVQERMKQNQRRKPPIGNYLLAGVLQCPECGSKMIGTKTKYMTKKGEVERRYYTCSAFHNKGLTACHANGIRADLIDPIAMKHITKKLSNPNLVETLYQYISENTINEDTIGGKKRILELEIEKQSILKSNFRSLLADGIITIDEFKEDIAKLDKKTHELNLLLEEVSVEVDKSEKQNFNITKATVEEFLKSIADLLQSSDDSEKRKIKELIKIIIKSIVVTERIIPNIEIELNYSEMLYSVLDAI